MYKQIMAIVRKSDLKLVKSIHFQTIHCQFIEEYFKENIFAKLNIFYYLTKIFFLLKKKRI